MNKKRSPNIDLTGEWEAEMESRTMKDRVYEAVTISAVDIAVNSE
ncbi:hypothetical protein [Halobellus limi]|jgi:hypothetical protein|uniref:Uncharacterized protein n=1 Tax=Halobellus limi TaxID=699433 RepID=A0A1H6BTT7_9EURY|nr:hypothetical protein [Halobellus limi]SEG64141.1 hypothetical protein SAMN04488133_3025 [Halobellus limi]